MNAIPTLEIVAPLSGVLKSIEASEDPVFAGRVVGDGVLIEPTSNLLVAPFAGTITQLHKAGHAIAIKSADGIEVLMHIGIDTVTLAGKGFASQVALQDAVQPGQPLIRFDLEAIHSAGLSSQTAILVTTGQTVTPPMDEPSVNAGVDIATRVTSTDTEASSDEPKTNQATLTADVIVPNPQGFHARPAAQLVQVVKQFQSSVRLTNLDNDHSANANSVTAIMGLETQRQTRLHIDVSGSDASDALVAIVEAIQSGLGEKISTANSENEPEFPEETPLLRQTNQQHNVIKAVKASSGMAAGRLVFLDKTLPNFPKAGVTVEDETAQLNYALGSAKTALSALVESLKQGTLAEQAGVFVAHLELLDDPALTDAANNSIQQGNSAMWSWHSAYTQEADTLSKLNNPLLNARASDINDVGERVLRILLGIDDPQTNLPDDTVLVMDDITPSEIVSLDTQKIVGLLTYAGGSTSHAAILASAMGLPYLVGVDRTLSNQPEHTQVILNANLGQLRIAPSEAELEEFRTLKSFYTNQLTAALRHANKPALTEDGVHIEVAANVANLSDAQAANEAGADGIGLVRSEFLYLNRASEPSFTEQTETYRGILAAMGSDKTTIIRTLDVGGDKPLPYLPLGEEENPFLGERGIRIGLNRPHLLRKQIRAILSASDAGIVRIMFPMIASLEEFQAARALVREEQEKLGIENVEVGVMIEVPSAALMADALAKEADFFSIGTNDLTQYTLAMDRGHPVLAAQVDALHPAVLRLIARTAEASQQEGKWTGICGSLASDPSAVPILIGLGVTELSCTAPTLPLIKEKVRSLKMSECKIIARAALNKATAQEVREMVAHHITQ